MKRRDLRMTRGEYDRERSSIAEETFKDHVLRSASANCWRISRRDGNAFSRNHETEVIVGMYGHVIIHGDIDTVVFAGGDNDDPVGQLRWVARSRGDIDYLAQKANRGMSNVGVECDDEKVARNNLLYHAGADRDDGCDFEDKKQVQERRRRMDVFRDALWMLDCAEPVSKIRDYLGDKLHDRDEFEWIHTIGRVVDPRVYCARAAVCKLVRLLDEKEGA